MIETGSSSESTSRFSAREIKDRLDRDISDYQKMVGGDVREDVFSTNATALSMHLNFQNLLKQAKQEVLRVNKKRYATFLANVLGEEAKKRRDWMSEEGLRPYTEPERIMIQRDRNELWRPGDPLRIPKAGAVFDQHRNRVVEMERIAQRYKAAAQGQTDYSFRI